MLNTNISHSGVRLLLGVLRNTSTIICEGFTKRKHNTNL